MFRIIAIVIFGLSSCRVASASLTYPQFDCLLAHSEGITVRYLDHQNDRGTYFLFDSSGDLQKELDFRDSNQPLKDPMLGASDDGRFWFISNKQNEKYEVISTRFVVFDQNQKLLKQKTLAGYWEAEVTHSGVLYVAQPDKSPLKIERLDLESGKLQTHALLKLTTRTRIVDLDAESSFKWTIGQSGKIYVLEGVDDEGIVRAFQKDGTLLWETRVGPEPKTSVAYMKDLIVDKEENVFVIHSSWEVSASTENSGSIVQFNSQGKQVLRIKKHIGYLQEIAIRENGDIYAYSLGSAIQKYSKDGTLTLSWDAIPPQYGESWSEKKARAVLAQSVTERSPLPDKLIALLYGNHEKETEVRKWILDQGFDSFPFLLKSFEEYAGWPLQYLLSSMIEKFPEQSEVTLRTQFAAASFSFKKDLLPLVKRSVNPPAGMKEFLLQLSHSEDPRDRSIAEATLAERGWSGEIYKAYLEKLRSQNLTEEKKNQILWKFSEDFASALEILQPVLFNEEDPLRKDAASALLASLTSQIRSSSYGAVPDFPKIAEDAVKGWKKSNDPFVRQIAAVAGLALGEKGVGKDALEAARAHPGVFTATVIFGFAVNQNEVGNQASDLITLVLSSTTPEDFAITMMDVGDIQNGSVGAQILKLVQNPQSEDWVLDGAFYALGDDNPGLKPTLKKDALQILTDTRLSRFVRLEGFDSYLMHVLEALEHDPEFVSALKTSLFPALLESGKDVELRDLMNALPDLLNAQDGSWAAAFLTNSSPVLVDLGLTIVAKSGAGANLKPRLLELLNDPRHELQAAKALTKFGNEQALSILIEKGLKRMGPYSAITVEGEYFLPFGETAEKRLLELLEYPNSSTQRAVRFALAQIKSRQGLKYVRKEFEKTIAANEAPDSSLIATLVIFGESPWASTVDVIQKLDDFCDCNLNSSEFEDSNVFAKSMKELESLLIQTSEEKRAQTIVKVIQAIAADEQSSAKVLRSAQSQHSDPKIRALIDASIAKD